MRKKLVIVIPVILAAAAICCLLFLADEKKTAETGFAMGSPVNVTVYGRGGSAAKDALDAVMLLDGEISRNIASSEISVLNENGAADLGGDALFAVERALEISRESGGAFDAGIGNLTRLWDFDTEAFTPPTDEEISSALTSAGGGIEITGSTVTLGENRSLDLGALGKGFACDKAFDALVSGGASAAVVDVGGTVGVLGQKRSGLFSVGIRVPEAYSTGLYATVKCPGGTFVSTSGRYEKFAEYGGRLYHHILDPKTGYPVESTLTSVTVFASSGLVADALSTACFVLGEEGSKKLLDRYSASAFFTYEDRRVTTYAADAFDYSITPESGYETYETTTS